MKDEARTLNRDINMRTYMLRQGVRNLLFGSKRGTEGEKVVEKF